MVFIRQFQRFPRRRSANGCGLVESTPVSFPAGRVVLCGFEEVKIQTRIVWWLAGGCRKQSWTLLHPSSVQCRVASHSSADRGPVICWADWAAVTGNEARASRRAKIAFLTTRLSGILRERLRRLELGNNLSGQMSHERSNAK